MTANFRRDAYDEISARLKNSDETFAEHLGNALQILRAWRSEPMPPEVNARVRERIDAALRNVGL